MDTDHISNTRHSDSARSTGLDSGKREVTQKGSQGTSPLGKKKLADLMAIDTPIQKLDSNHYIISNAPPSSGIMTVTLLTKKITLEPATKAAKGAKSN